MFQRNLFLSDRRVKILNNPCNVSNRVFGTIIHWLLKSRYFVRNTYNFQFINLTKLHYLDSETYATNQSVQHTTRGSYNSIFVARNVSRDFIKRFHWVRKWDRLGDWLGLVKLLSIPISVWTKSENSTHN